MMNELDEEKNDPRPVKAREFNNKTDLPLIRYIISGCWLLPRLKDLELYIVVTLSLLGVQSTDRAAFGGRTWPERFPGPGAV